MKILYLFASITILLPSCSKEKKEIDFQESTPKIHNGLFVKGAISLPDNSIILLQEKLSDKIFNTLKTTKVLNNSFSFKKNIDEEKLLYVGFSKNDKKIPFIANNYETFIDVNAAGVAKIQGSKVQQEFTNFSNKLDKAKNKFVFKTRHIKDNPNSILSAIILKEMLGNTKWRNEQNKKAYNSLTPKIQKSALGKYIINFIDKNEALVAKSVSVAEISLDPEVSNETPIKIVEKKVTVTKTPYRKKAPNFYAESIAGNDISLNSILKNNKVVLIDFWASWCAPCKAQNPQLKRLYKKYKAKGFDVIGVSEDKYSDKQKWKNSISQEGLPWHQVIDDNKRVAKMFGVTAIPHLVLLDKNGGIILNKKTPYTIEKKLKEIFGF